MEQKNKKMIFKLQKENYNREKLII